MSIFIDREVEMNALKRRFNSDNAEFLIIYGRRRVGKTELIKQFYAKNPHVYYLCTKSNDLEQMKNMAKRVAENFNERVPELNSWEEFFSYLADKTKEKRLVFVVDEYPYLRAANGAIPSIFQLGWDEYLNKTKIFLILCGSSISVMEEELSYRAPLYGRRTGQIRLEPLSFADSVRFFPTYDMRNKVYAYSILGSIPMYLLEFNPEADILSNISEHILRKDSILYEEPVFLLREELREPDTYSRIFEVLALRGAKLSDIAGKIGLDQHKLPKYLGVLIKLNYIEKLSPVTVKKPKSKQTRYILKDNFFRFWYHYIYPNRSDIEGENKDKVLALIKADIDRYTSIVFEGICMQLLKNFNQSNMLPFTFSAIGTWWGHHRQNGKRLEVEIDLVAIEKNKKEVLFVECKWADLREMECRTILAELKEKSKYVDYPRKAEYFGLFGRKIHGKENLRNEGFVVFDLDDVERLIKPSK
jgi:AAA+ ATPase superfamily predicted ATPase